LGRSKSETLKQSCSASARSQSAQRYLQLGGKLRSGEIKTEQTFREASEQYLPEYDIITQGNATRDRWTASTAGPGCI
jgi:predicted S18 family serine protease